MLAAVAYARLTNTPYLLMNEVYLRQPRSWWRKLVKTPLVRSVVSKAAGCLPTGTLATEYLRHYGAREGGLCNVPNVPDVEQFRRRARELEMQRDEIRLKKKLGPGPVVLFVSRLIGLKRVDLLLDAAREFLRDRDLTVVILGDGPMRAKWEQLAESRGISDRVRFEGFIAPGDLPEWYAVSDLFVLPSTDETWSVVVLESLASGVPVIITDLVGCCADVINDPLVGTVVPAGEAAPIAEAMRRHLAISVSKSDVMDAWEPVFDQLRYEVISKRLSAHLHEICAGRGRIATGE
jgi:glycosyltransferase involved in cell wall biosynthesis